MRYRQAKKIFKKYTSLRAHEEMVEMLGWMGALRSMAELKLKFIDGNVFDRAKAIFIRRQFSGIRYERMRRRMRLKLIEKIPELAGAWDL